MPWVFLQTKRKVPFGYVGLIPGMSHYLAERSCPAAFGMATVLCFSGSILDSTMLSRQNQATAYERDQHRTQEVPQPQEFSIVFFVYFTLWFT
jgi:hypothetical protein